MQLFLLAIVTEEIVHSGSFENSKPHLKAYCDSEMLNFSVVESALQLFFALLADYNQAHDPVLYHFLQLQAGNCLLDEQSFALLPIAPPDEVFSFDLLNTPGSANQCGLVGSHLIGL